MNIDLAIMALEGLGRSPLLVTVDGTAVTISGPGSSFKELARLCLLLGSEETEAGEQFELNPSLHLKAESPMLKLSRD